MNMITTTFKMDVKNINDKFLPLYSSFERGAGVPLKTKPMEVWSFLACVLKQLNSPIIPTYIYSKIRTALGLFHSKQILLSQILSNP